MGELKPNTLYHIYDHIDNDGKLKGIRARWEIMKLKPNTTLTNISTNCSTLGRKETRANALIFPTRTIFTEGI